MPVTCPSCGYRSDLPEDAAGKSVRCPRCKRAFVVPTAAGGESELDNEVDEAELPPGRSRKGTNQSVLLNVAAGALVLLGGALIMIGLQTKTTVSTAGAGEVNNIGLMQDKLLSVLGGVGAFGIGVLTKILAVFPVKR